jgi:DtxR family Mn-dependent transcriptional regulator
VNALVPRRLEEILEHVFTEREEGRDAASAILAASLSDHAPDARAADLAELASAGLVQLDDDRVHLTPEGEARAKDVVRRHRLTERLFRDLLDLGGQTMEDQACEFEHILSREATESVCTLLGHPPTCPHGKPIPPGECCGAYQRTMRPLVTGLKTFDVGGTGRIVFIAPRFHDRMDRLAALGVIPGSVVKLHQRSPSYVIEVGETTIALDPEIAGEIFVKPVDARSR